MDSSRLRIPAALAVTLLGCGPSVDPEPGTTTDETTTSAPTTTTSAPTTTATTTTTTTTGEDTSTTGPSMPPDCSVHAYVAECENEEGCFWRADSGCLFECAEISDMQQCIAQAHCVWTDQCGYPGPI